MTKEAYVLQTASAILAASWGTGQPLTPRQALTLAKKLAEEAEADGIAPWQAK